MNSSYSSSLQNPITRSTTARLYQERSNRTISPLVGQVSHVALEVPLAPLALGRRGRAPPPGAPRGLRCSVNRLIVPPFASGVTTLEEDHQTLVCFLDPDLGLEEFDLQQPLELVVLVAGHPLRVRVPFPPSLDRYPVRADQDRIVDLGKGAVHGETLSLQLLVGQLSQRGDDVGQLQFGHTTKATSFPW